MVLDKIISSDQAGYIKKRYIGKNLRLIQDIIEYAERNKTRGAIIFLDFQKAFDTLEWGFMHNAMKKVQFWTRFPTVD